RPRLRPISTIFRKLSAAKWLNIQGESLHLNPHMTLLIQAFLLLPELVRLPDTPSPDLLYQNNSYHSILTAVVEYPAYSAIEYWFDTSHSAVSAHHHLITVERRPNVFSALDQN